MRFHERVRQLAEERGMSQADVARATGFNTSQVTYLFNGKQNAPRIDTVCILAEAFGVSINEFSDGLEFDQKDGSIFEYHLISSE